MSKQTDALQTYVSDMIALEDHILKALERQRDDAKTKTFPDALAFINRAEGVLRGHLTALNQRMSGLNGGGGGLKDAVAAVAGGIAGLIDKVRADAVSKMLRDDYTALNLACVSYTMLHTTGLACKDQQTADMALRHLNDLTPLVMEINTVIPKVVMQELTEDGRALDTTIVPEAVKKTQNAWQPSKH